jgi:hypothetical protein
LTAAFQEAAKSGAGFFRQWLRSGGEEFCTVSMEDFGKKQGSVQGGGVDTGSLEQHVSFGKTIPDADQFPASLSITGFLWGDLRGGGSRT